MNATVPDFSKLRVAVIGDLIADHYLNAEPRRLSREAPVMVLRHLSEHLGAGGAANLARNLSALGSQVAVFGQVGADVNGRELLRLLEADGLDTRGIALEPSWTTPTKTRVLAAEPRRFPQQVLRIDREPAAPVQPEHRVQVAGSLAARAQDFDCVLVSDYEYGLVESELGELCRELVDAGLIVVLDPRREPERFAGITSLTPNVGELARFTGALPEALDEPVALRRAALELLERVQTRYLLVTRGNLGMALFGEGLPESGVAVEASGDGEVTDVSGAGDSAAAVFALALAAKLDAPAAMCLANSASGVVVMENGAAVCTREQLTAALPTSPAPVKLGSLRLP